MLLSKDSTYFSGILWSLLESVTPTDKLKEIALSALQDLTREDRSSAAAYLAYRFGTTFVKIAPELLNDVDLYVQFEAAIFLFDQNWAGARIALERLQKTGPEDLSSRAGLALLPPKS